MVFVRKIKKHGKIYNYLYESKRVGDKVISVYKGKVNDKKKEVKQDILRGFNEILININRFIEKSEVESAKISYSNLLEEYNKISEKVNDEKKMELFNKTKDIYERLNDLN